MNSSDRFVYILQFVVLFVALAGYVLAIGFVGRASLLYPNFVEVADASGNTSLQPSPPIPIPGIITTLLTGISPLLALNLGRVLGITLDRAKTAQQTGNPPPAAGADEKLFGLHAKYWVVVGYLIGLVVAGVYFLQDGGASSNPGTIASVLEDYTLDFVALIVGVVGTFILR